MTREELNEEIHQKIEEEEKNEKKKKIVKLSIKIIFFLTIFFTLFYTYTTFISTVKISVREYRIIHKKIPNSFNGLKIIQFSDLHLGSTIFLEDMPKIEKLINERKPDILIFTGDLIQKNYNMTSQEQENFIKNLQSLSATLGKYAILGDEDSENTVTILNQSNFTILRNEYDLIYKNNNESILLIGLSSNEKKQNITKAYQYFEHETYNSNIYTITLLHEPDTVDSILNKYSTDLFIAGHSHNGNIRIPFFNKSLFKTKGALKYNQEHYSLKNSELYISSGLGTTTGIRLFCRPTINFFRLSNQ